MDKPSPKKRLQNRKRKRELVALFLLSYRYFVTLNVLWVGLHCVIVVFSDHTHFFSVLKLFTVFNLISVGCIWFTICLK